MKYYDRPYYLSCVVDISGLKAMDREAVIGFLKEKYQAFELDYPSRYAGEVAIDMANKGNPTMKHYPTVLTNSQALELFSKSLTRMYLHANVRRIPDTGRLNKLVRNLEDYVRIVDDLTLQQDGISLSFIYQTAMKPKIAFATRDTPINVRIGKRVIHMGDEFIGKKRMEERLALLNKEIEDTIQLSKEEDDQAFNEAKYAMR